VVDSNSPLLSALVDRDGGLSGALRILNDRADELRAALVGSAADVILISGGSSVGQEDHAPGIVDELGSLDFHGVTMRPSSPAGGGRIDGRFVFLLPGNPVSCLCAYEFFAGPTIRGLGGRSRDWPHRRFEGVLGRKIVSQVGRTDYVRVEIVDGEVIPIATSGASILSSTVRAAGAVIVPRGSEGLAAGSAVEVLLYD
jgi:molybdopterin molybdotransferase